MVSIKRVVSTLFHYFIGSYENSSVERLPTNSEDTTTLHVKSLGGVTIRFYCKKTNFVIKNEHSLIPDYKYSVYTLSGECGEGKCPEKLIKVLSNQAHFPTLRPIFISEETRRKFLIETYISFLNSELKQLSTT